MHTCCSFTYIINFVCESIQNTVRVGRSEVRIPAGINIFLFLKKYRPSLGPSQHRIRWAQWHLSIVKAAGAWRLTLRLVSRLWMSGAVPLCLYGVGRNTFTFTTFKNCCSNWTKYFLSMFSEPCKCRGRYFFFIFSLFLPSTFSSNHNFFYKQPLLKNLLLKQSVVTVTGLG